MLKNPQTSGKYNRMCPFALPSGGLAMYVSTSAIVSRVPLGSPSWMVPCKQHRARRLGEGSYHQSNWLRKPLRFLNADPKFVVDNVFEEDKHKKALDHLRYHEPQTGGGVMWREYPANLRTSAGLSRPLLAERRSYIYAGSIVDRRSAQQLVGRELRILFFLCTWQACGCREAVGPESTCGE